MNKSKSLVICASPLQAMIAERIIALHPREEFHLIIYSLAGMSDKYNYYAQRLAKKCQSVRYIKNDIFRSSSCLPVLIFYIIYYRILYWLNYRFIEKIYVSSYEHVPIRLLIGSLNSDIQIYSFDDGLINLLSDTYSRSKSDDTSLLYRTFNVDYPSSIKAKLGGHYTIYNIPTASHTNSHQISLFNIEETNEVIDITSHLSVFLGQPLFEFDAAPIKSKQLTQAVFWELRCHLYLPHPREDYKVDGVEYIDTPLIAEDYLLQELEKHPERRYTVYSYFSTTLMNLKDHPRIKMVACRPASVPERWQESYELLERMGIEIREFPNL